MKRNSLTLLIILFFLISFCELSAQSPVKLCAGLSAGGSGLAGIPIQIRPAKFIALDLGVYYRTVRVDEFEDKRFFGPSADAGINIFLTKKHNSEKSKITENGFYLKGAFGLHKKEDGDIFRIQENMASVGWLVEINKDKNPGRFFQIQLGPSIIQKTENFLNTRYPPGEQLQSSERFSGMIYGRLSWFFSITK